MAFIDTTYAVARQAGGLEGHPKGIRALHKHLFLVLFAGKEYEKIEILGRPSRPKPHHRVSRVIEKKGRLPCGKRPFDVVELRRIELLTSTLPVLRSPS
jgi:hypothetical protein